MRELLKVLKAAGDKNRLRILKMLEQKPMCVCELAAVLGITQPSVSKHLSLLKEAGLVSDEREGQWIEYRLCQERINQYAPLILRQLKAWVNDDTCVKHDRKTAASLCRQELCKK
ncbi:MAG: winged helix-turn-helix transcriptional regulator [Deltaproteobacteria bacterium]|nr:winged helix-turn-helix transcriptional regulator [Deltaproteobacteria bacterium]